MPYLARFGTLSMHLRNFPLVTREAELLCRLHGADEIMWRLCIWVVNSGERPAENRQPVWLEHDTPLEVLQSIQLSDDVPGASNGRALVGAALAALQHDCLDCKWPLLVLADWLEEQQQPEHRLLRMFAHLEQTWTRFSVLFHRPRKKGRK
jgi:hypothetical protein